MKRHQHDGIRKVCGCPRRNWAKCGHPWHFAFKWKGTHHRFSLNRQLGKEIESKTQALAEADDLRRQIRAGTFGKPAPRLEMTLTQLVNVYLKRYVEVERPAALKDFRLGLLVVTGTSIALPTGGTLPFGAWRLSDITTDTIERYREARHALGTGPGGLNRSLSRLRALFNWGVRVGYVDGTPFRRNGVNVVKLARELPRRRRLDADADEAGRLLAACRPHLRAVVECALETGMRRGEIMNLQWWQVEGLKVERRDDASYQFTWAPRSEVVLPAAKTKTRRDRRIPISSRLRAVLEMRRLDPAGQPLPSSAYVFGTEVGKRVTDVGRAFETAVLKAHGHKMRLTPKCGLTPECRAALRGINLHFHDLRREAGSRWMDAGVPIATIQRWLGHTNVSQTSTYLAGTSAGEHEAMRRFEERIGRAVAVNSDESADTPGLQQFAIPSGTEGQNETRSAKVTN